MWRLQSFLSRVIHRYPGNTPLRLSQNHYVEDEVINGSTLLSNSLNTSDSSSQRGEDGGGKRRKQKTSRFCSSELRYTALDAVGWGAAAALFVQICRRLHSQLSSGTRPSSAQPGPPASPSTLHKCGYQVLLEILSTRDVWPRARGVVCLHMLPERQDQAEHHVHNPTTSRSSSSSGSSSSSSSSSSSNIIISSEHLEQLSIDCSHSDHQRTDLSQNCSLEEAQSPSTSSHLAQNHPVYNGTQTPGDGDKVLSGEERLAEAASNLGHVGDSSVPVILNIIGLEMARSHNYEVAFSCFTASAQHGYSKAQFNAGVCLEKGRGVTRDVQKALQYYWQAAEGGHSQAQYRYAKLLLTTRGQPSPQEWSTAVSLLEQAAAAGLTEAQVFLGSVFSQEPVMDGRKSVHYLQMAAQSGDSRALLHLGQCYDRGFGVQRNTKLAVSHYEKAALAGNTQAQGLLRLRREDEAALRSIRSAPCFSLVSLQPPHHRLLSTTARLPHSWSTGSLDSTTTTPLPLHLHLHPLGPRALGGGGPCQWALGV